MGGSEAAEWFDALEAAFDAAVARDEDAAAADLAFSLRQDVDVRATIARAPSAWTLVGADGSAAPVTEVGIDYVRGGTLLVRSAAALLRSTPGTPPAVVDRSFLEVLGSHCRAGTLVTVGGATGRLVRVGKDHLALRHGEAETIVGLGSVDAVRLVGESVYSDSRGLSG
ncbi:MAG TPA: hypothetical protein VHN37_07760 [Actinomycetota bacterium]|nr:hypothetical protein [Actinomycetota bacterium]